MSDNITRIIIRAVDQTAPTFASIIKGFGGVQTAARALGIGLSVTAFAGLIKGAIDAQDHLNDLSKTTGIAVEQLAGLRLAAKQSGTDLDSVAEAVNKLAVNMGKDAEKFAALGITAKSPLEAYGQLADIFNAIEDPQQRAAVAAAALGRSWEETVPLLSEGSAKIREMVAEGERLSGVTKKSAEAADKFNDNWEKAAATAKGFGVSVANPIIEGINKIVDALGKEMGRKEGSIVAWIVGQMGTVNLGGNVKTGQAIWDAQRGVNTPAAPVASPSRDRLKNFIGGEGKGKTAKADKIDDVTQQLRVIAKEWSELGKSGSDLELFRLQTMGATEEQIKLAESLLKTIDAHKEEQEALEHGRRAFEEEQAAMVKAMEEREQRVTDFTRKASENIQDSLADFLFDPFEKGLGGMLDGFTNMLRRMAAEAAAADIARRLFGGGGVGSGGGLLGPLVNAGLSMFGLGGTQAPAPVRDAIPIPVPSFAVGTSYVPRDMLAMIHKGEKIVSAGENNARTGTVINVNFAISGAVDSRTQQQIAAQAGSAVQRAMRRNG